MPTILRGILHISFDGRYDTALQELLTKGFGISLAPTRPQVAAPTAPEILAPPPPKTETLPRTIINPKDGKEMILIPAGEFLMGSDEIDNAKPPHKVSLDAFYIARYPATNADYKSLWMQPNILRHPIGAADKFPTAKRIIRS